MAKNKDTGIVNIHGKEYKTVALRVSEFRDSYSIKDGWGITTSIIHHDDAKVIVRADITSPSGMIVGTGHGEEVRSSSAINKTSALENAETSAIGRALASVGLAGSEYASADEVARAISQQGPVEPRKTQAGAGPTEKQKAFLRSLVRGLEDTAYVDELGLRVRACKTTQEMSDLIDQVMDEVDEIRIAYADGREQMRNE